MCIRDVVDWVCASLCTVRKLNEALMNAAIVVIAEANLDNVQSTEICLGVRETMRLSRVPVLFYSDDRKDPRNPRPGYTINNIRKRFFIDRLREFLALDSVSIARTVVCEQGVALAELRRQLAQYEYSPLVEKSTGRVTGYTFDGKRHGPDDMATILFSAVAIAVVWMAHDAPPSSRRHIVGRRQHVYAEIAACKSRALSVGA